MAKKGRHRKGGRVTTKGARPLSAAGRASEPPLLSDIRRALRDDHPLALLALVSSVLTAVDPRQRNPFDRDRRGEDWLSRAELIRTFTDIDRPETSAVLAVAAAFGADDVERRRSVRILESREATLPTWLASLDRATAYRTVELTHILGDGDDVLVGVRFSTGHELTALVYIDHNMGTLVKDAFVVPEPIRELVAMLEAKAEPESAFGDIPAADAKARIVDAVATGAITLPPFETETWPACRPLVEWIAGLLPEGGHGYQRPEWSDDERRALAERFFASSFAAGLEDDDHRGLMEDLLWFACDYGPGDPLRWSPVSVEIVLADWIPRKIVAEVAYLKKAPNLLRAFVRFCHTERGIPPALTEDTLVAIDRWAPVFQQTIRSPRLQGPEALLAAVGAIDADAAPWNYETVMLLLLEQAVGGAAALAALDDVPLPDEPFDWAGVPADVHDRVAEVLVLCDQACDELLDVEYRTAARRLLARIGSEGPEVFRRRGRAETAAAAICWSIGRANDLFDQRRGGLTQKAFLAHFGIKQGGVGDRAGTLLDAAGIDWQQRDFTLESPDYLVSRRRRKILETRDRLA